MFYIDRKGGERKLYRKEKVEPEICVCSQNKNSGNYLVLRKVTSIEGLKIDFLCQNDNIAKHKIIKKQKENSNISIFPLNNHPQSLTKKNIKNPFNSHRKNNYALLLSVSLFAFPFICPHLFEYIKLKPSSIKIFQPNHLKN